MIPRIQAAVLAVLTLLCCVHTASAKSSSSTTQYVTYQSPDGDTVYLSDDRRPSLYTGNFGDCLGTSAINVTRFDAAYYADNMTVLFHLEGNTGLANESLMMYIGVYAYGESRFDLTFDPCAANIASLCPANSSVPIEASGIIPVSVSDVSSFPTIAFSIPDFEGQAILRIFANSTESEIACFSAVITNGNSFSHPASVGTVLGIFTLIAVFASFATAAYGEAVPTMRLHYAHSLSVGVVFAVFQHIFFTGALSMNWPSVLVAWWSNFAWAGGMIYTGSMQSSINNLIGLNVGNTSEVGAASAGSNQNNLGGGYDLSLIYKRALSSGMRQVANHPFARNIAKEIYRRREHGEVLRRDLVQHSLERTLQRRDIANSSTGYRWYGRPVGVGLPLPGNYSGFAGTLAEEGIRTSNAFMTGFLWFLILLAVMVGALMIFKWILEGMSRLKWVKDDRMSYFRRHWLGYSAVLALRICYLAFFMIMFLTIFQFTYESSGGVKAIAGIVFAVFLVGIPGAAAYAYLYKKRVSSHEPGAAYRQVERKTLLGKIPWFRVKKVGATSGDEQGVEMQPTDDKGNSWNRLSTPGSFTDHDGNQYSVHDNEDYTTKFGWLAARFRRTRWWFFMVLIFYEFVRAIFYAGASGYPLVQVFGLLVIEVVAFAYVLWAKPFEGRRLNVLVVYCLGFSKVTSVGLSAAFDVNFNLQRIVTTVIGVIIIVIQGLLTIITLIAIIVGAISSYMSVSRNHEDFRPRKWAGLRERYFNHLDKAVNDLPPEPKPKPAPEPDNKEPYFQMNSVRRMNKIEDEDKDFASEMRLQDPAASYLSLEHRAASPAPGSLLDGRGSGAGTPVRRSRAGSMQSISQTNLPYGARSHRPSWSTRDFTDGNDRAYTPVDMTRIVPDDEPIAAPSPAAKAGHFRSSSRNVQNPKLREQSSNPSLNVGGDISTQNTIGKVPAPTIRPRAGTYGSMRSRSNTPTFGESTDRLGDLNMDTQPGGSQRGSRAPLTPAQEQEEFMLARNPSRKH